MENLPVDRIREAIEQATGPGRQQGDNWRLRCPAHSDRDPSLSLGANPEQHALIYCQAGCDTDAVLSAIGLTRRDLYPHDPNQRNADPIVATYRYTESDGTLLYEVLRSAAKQFRQRRPDPDKPGRWLYNLQGVPRVLYRLPLVVQAIRDSQTIYLVEGEKDVHTLEALGQVATTSPGGASKTGTKWRPEYTQTLRGAHLVIIADRDEPGIAHARSIYHAMGGIAASLTLVQPTAGKDITDHLHAGLELDALDFLSPEIPTSPSAANGSQPEAIGGGPEAPVSPAPGGGGDLPPRNPLRAIPASAFRMRAVRWVWEARMPIGEICIIPGREGIGKSTFLAWMAAMITRGNLPGVYYGQPRAVLYAAAEDAWDYTIAPRMHAAGADLDLVKRLDVVYDDSLPDKLVLPRDNHWIPDFAKEHDTAILMCDPIVSNIDETINVNYSRELRRALEPLRRAAEEAQIAVVGLAHFNKSKDVDPATMVAGGRGWVEVARSLIVIAREDRDGPDGESRPVQVVSQQKNNLGRLDLPSLEYEIESYRFPLDDGTEIETSRLVWADGPSMTTAQEVLTRRPGGPSGRESGRSNIDQVLDVLDDAAVAMSPREITDKLGDRINHATVKQILHRLATGDKIERVGTGLYQAKTLDKRGDASRVARDAPFVSPSPVPSQTKLYERVGSGDKRGGVSPIFAGSTIGDGDTKGADTVSPVLSPLVSCRVCHGPLEDVDGVGIHPSCGDT